MAFAVVTIFYSVVSMYLIRRASASVELGFNRRNALGRQCALGWERERKLSRK